VESTARANYIVSRPGTREIVELFDDEVVSRSEGLFGSHTRIAYKLDELIPRPFEYSPRDQLITALIGAMTVFGVLPFAVLLVRFGPTLPDGVVPAMALGWLIVGALFALLHPFRIHCLGFRTVAGLTAIYLAKVGRNRAQRDAFASELQRAIEAKVGSK
jgi:hypothetical protein